MMQHRRYEPRPEAAAQRLRQLDLVGPVEIVENEREELHIYINASHVVPSVLQVLGECDLSIRRQGKQGAALKVEAF